MNSGRLRAGRVAAFPLPTHCGHCGVFLQGGATVHAETCPFYPLSYYALTKHPELWDRIAAMRKPSNPQAVKGVV